MPLLRPSCRKCIETSQRVFLKPVARDRLARAHEPSRRAGLKTTSRTRNAPRWLAPCTRSPPGRTGRAGRSTRAAAPCCSLRTRSEHEPVSAPFLATSSTSERLKDEREREQAERTVEDPRGGLVVVAVLVALVLLALDAQVVRRRAVARRVGLLGRAERLGLRARGERVVEEANVSSALEGERGEGKGEGTHHEVALADGEVAQLDVLRVLRVGHVGVLVAGQAEEAQEDVVRRAEVRRQEVEDVQVGERGEAAGARGAV